MEINSLRRMLYLKDEAGSNIILHYDVKLVKEFTKGKKLARETLALSITCDGEHSLLGVLYCSDATQTEAIIYLLRDYELNDAVKGLVFDPTASNTRREKGVNSRLNSH